ncbi:MAG: V-type ATP synthase subunit E family protein [Thermoproteota archaeon]|nr:V-type ATP synthase subunit E family protein [Thermoproteota archaeon]
MLSLDTFLNEIESRKRSEISFLDNTLAEKRSSIQKAKENTIKELKEYYANEANTRCIREGARISEAARLKAKNILFDAINKNMDSTFELIRQQIKDYVEGPQYLETLQKMISCAEKELGPPITIHCRLEDVSALKKINANMGSTINTLGGILAEDERGIREMDLTFEELLRVHEDEIKNLLLERMMNL